MRRTKQQKLMLYTRHHFYNKILSDMDQLEEKVCWLLAKHEHLRNCDNCLILKIWKDVDNWNGLPYEQEVHRLTSSDSITRVRRKLQEMGLWIPTDEDVIKARRIKESAIRDWAINDHKMTYSQINPTKFGGYKEWMNKTHYGNA